jgi:hypothetical protein
LFLCVGNEWEKSLPKVDGAKYIMSIKEQGLSLSTAYLHKGATSGYAALGIAVLKRARKIILLGFDYGVSGSRHHYHESYPWHHRASDMSWKVWAEKYEVAASDCWSLGIEVLNASPSSCLTCFKKISLEEAIYYYAAT